MCEWGEPSRAAVNCLARNVVWGSVAELGRKGLVPEGSQRCGGAVPGVQAPPGMGGSQLCVHACKQARTSGVVFWSWLAVHAFSWGRGPARANCQPQRVRTVLLLLAHSDHVVPFLK